MDDDIPRLPEYTFSKKDRIKFGLVITLIAVSALTLTLILMTQNSYREQPYFTNPSSVGPGDAPITEFEVFGNSKIERVSLRGYDPISNYTAYLNGDNTLVLRLHGGTGTLCEQGWFGESCFAVKRIETNQVTS